jgi:hypothetical protein
MTIAIGTRYDDGAIVCADTKVVSTDGSTSTGRKAFVSVSSNQLSCAVANAADDAHAAKMLASYIADAVGSSLAWTDVPNKIKKIMTDWYSAFGAVKPPLLHFLLASGGKDHSELYFCEPPNTVLSCHESMAIGQGARPLDNITSHLFWPWLAGGVKGALLKLAFLMYRAKTEEGSACGGATTTLIVTKRGRFAFIPSGEMEAAENLAKNVEDWLMEIRKSVLGGAAKEETAKELSKQHLYLSSRVEELEFPSLSRLERPMPWEKP